MKRYLVVVLALTLVSLASSVAFARPVGNPFLKGLSSPTELADKVQASLAKNPNGTNIIDPNRCKHGGSCATPSDFLKMFQESDPTMQLKDVSEVPSFLRTLRVEPAPSGEYWLACLKPSGKGKFRPVLHCLSRSFKKNENVWVNPKSGRLVLASDCTNPVEKSVPKACVEIHFFTKPGDTAVRFALLGPNDVQDACVGVKRAGEEDFENIWAKECENAHCDFSADVAVVGQQVRLMGSYATTTPGEHILRLPAFVAEKSLWVTVLCLERGNTAWPEFPEGQVSYAAYGERRQEWINNHSDGMGVRWFDYLNNKSGVKRATLYYTRTEIPKNAPQLYWPWGEWAAQQEAQR